MGLEIYERRLCTDIHPSCCAICIRWFCRLHEKKDNSSFNLIDCRRTFVHPAHAYIWFEIRKRIDELMTCEPAKE